MKHPKSRSENSDMPINRRSQALSSDNPVGRRIIEALRGRPTSWLAEKSGIPPQTVSDYIKRGIGRADGAVKVAAALGCSVDWLLTGSFQPSVMQSQSMGSDDVVDIPILTTTASAGRGSVPVDPIEERGAMSFPRAWARAFGTPSRLRLVEIAGDSMSPDLNDGDWLLINLDLIEVREGVALVRVDEELYVKRLEPQGNTLLLTSTNPAYQPIVVNRRDEAERERVVVIGRARWSGKALS